MSPLDGAWLASTIAILAPLLLATTGEVVSEKAGVLNVGLEGYMLTGAFFGIWAASATGGNILVGLSIAMLAGIVAATIMAIATLKLEANQVVTGVGINLLALGLTSFLLKEQDSGFLIAQPGKLRIPFLKDLPFVGKALFEQHLTTYAAFAIVAAVWFIIYQTKLGIVLRACGEYPSAADTAGHNVQHIRFWSVLFAGAMGGLAGAQLSVVEVGTFQEDMINGRGFLALAAVIIGRWHPGGAMLAAGFFAATDALQLRLQAHGSIPASIWIVLGAIALYGVWRCWRNGSPIPGAICALTAVLAVILAATTPEFEIPFQFWRALPLFATLFILATVGSADAEPAKLTQPYQRGA